MDEKREEPEIREKKIKSSFWPIFGWSVISLMALLIVLNFLDVLDPVVNKIGLPVLFVSYIIYVNFRGRKSKKVIE